MPSTALEGQLVRTGAMLALYDFYHPSEGDLLGEAKAGWIVVATFLPLCESAPKRDPPLSGHKILKRFKDTGGAWVPIGADRDPPTVRNRIVHQRLGRKSVWVPLRLCRTFGDAGYAVQIMRAWSMSIFPRPYIWRLTSLSLVIWPSV